MHYSVFSSQLNPIKVSKGQNITFGREPAEVGSSEPPPEGTDMFFEIQQTVAEDLVQNFDVILL